MRPFLIVELVRKHVSIFPVGYCGHIVLGYVWLVGQFVQHSLQVREVIEVGRKSFLDYE